MQNEVSQKITVDSESLIRRYEREIRDLKLELAMHDTLVGRGRISYEPYTLEEQFEEQKRAARFLNNEIEDIEIQSIRQVKELFFQFKNLYHSAQARIQGPCSCQGKTPKSEKRDNPSEKDDQSVEQKENKQRGVGTLNHQFGFSLGNAHPNSRPALPLEDSLLIKNNGALRGRQAPRPNMDMVKQLVQKKSLFNYDDIGTEGRTEGPIPDRLETYEKRELFEHFKRSQGREMVLDVKNQTLLLKRTRSELDVCIQNCNDLKGKIDDLLRQAKGGESAHPKKQNSEEEYNLQIRVKQLKKEHSESLRNYRELKKIFKIEEKKLLGVKKVLIRGFETSLRGNTGRGGGLEGSQDLSQMDSQEQTYVKAKQKFETLRRLRKLDRFN